MASRAPDDAVAQVGAPGTMLALISWQGIFTTQVREDEMSYSATVRRLLISSPGDVPISDLAIIRKSINRWNGIYGQQFASAIIPISWGSHAAAEFGRHPQEILNDQLVDECDICIAIFANRLGAETPNAESGTVEELERLHNAGRYVAVLRSTRPVNASQIDLSQAARLEEYMSKIQGSALVLSYSDDTDLHSHVDAVLNAAVLYRATTPAQNYNFSLRLPKAHLT